MCGIYGQVTRELVAGGDGSTRAFVDGARAQLRHRGPDGAGDWSDDHCVLGHLRLAILDLSEQAAQPMASSSRRTRLVFNGEIYNYVEVRATLTPPVGGFRSSSDTEVLVEALDQHGIRALADLVGMFAIAVWRPAERELWLIRDRLGKKPLYWAMTARGDLRFASEVGALLGDGQLPRETTLDRLAEYLQHGYVAAPRTGFRDVHVVPPGCLLRVRVREDGRIATAIERYWKLPDSIPPLGSRAEFDELFRTTLEDAVRIRLRSDVPLGAFLSGGVDSSVVSLLAARALQGGTLRTFTVDFAERDFSEGSYASQVARALGTDHTTLRLGDRSLETLRDLVTTYGDLHGDPSALPTMALCRATREHVTVALAGDGGDELLAGYARYASTLMNARAAARLPDSALRASRFVGRHVMPRWMRGATRLARLSADVGEFYARDVRSYATEAWPGVLAPDRVTNWPDAVAAALDANAARPDLLRLMACDVATYLPEDILVKVDRASMAVGLEVRAPLLDHRLFELVMHAEPEWLLERGTGKTPLRRVYGASLPGHVFERKKMGFGVPLRQWFRGRPRSFIRGQLTDPRSPVASVLNPRAIDEMLLVHELGVHDESSRIWHLLVMSAWFDLWRPTIAAGAPS